MKPHLCLFTDSLEPSGVGQHMLTLAGELRAHYRISLIVPPSPSGLGLLAQARDLGLAVLGLEAQFHQPLALAGLRAWLEAARVDIFHCHAGIGWEGFGGVDAARAAGVPVVVRTEHLPYLLTHPVQRADHSRTAQVVDALICVSEEVAATHTAAGVPAHKLRVVRNGIPIRVARRHPGSRAQLDLPAGGRLIVTVGRLSEQKGHRYLLAAVPEVLAAFPDATFLWVGSGPLAAELHAEVQRRGLVAQVRFLERRTDIPQLLAAADLFVLPSLFEGLPLVVLEAMAAGLPVVATRVCGSSEAVEDGVTGRLVPARDPAALGAAVVDVLAHPQRAAQWGAAGRVRVAHEFSARRMAREMAAVYEELRVGRALVPAPAAFPLIAYPEA